MTLIIKASKKNDTIVLQTCGYINALTVNNFKSSINCINNNKIKTLIIECCDLQYISSSGLAVIAEVLCVKQDLKVIMRNLNIDIAELFATCGIDVFIDIQ